MDLEVAFRFFWLIFCRALLGPHISDSGNIHGRLWHLKGTSSSQYIAENWVGSFWVVHN